MDDLTEDVAKRARAAGFDVEVVGPGELLLSGNSLGETRVYLDNLSASLDAEDSDAERGDVIEAFVTGLVPGDSRTLVAIVKSEEWLEYATDKQLSPGQVRCVAGDLHAVLAWDEGTRISASKMSVEDLGDDPFAEGIKGVLAMSEPIEMSGDALKMLTCGGNYEASMLLVDDVWDFVAEHVDGDVIAAAPARDLLFATGSNSSVGLSEMEAAVRRVFEGDFSYRVSRAMLRRQDGGWTIERVVD